VHDVAVNMFSGWEFFYGRMGVLLRCGFGFFVFAIGDF
jgi:hypothetical protein